jgi:hypothetical protein
MRKEYKKTICGLCIATIQTDTSLIASTKLVECLVFFMSTLYHIAPMLGAVNPHTWIYHCLANRGWRLQEAMSGVP